MTHHDPENVVSKSIVVAVAVDQAFRVWTEQIKRWWPAGHSLSGDPHTKVFLESRVGGRFFERASNGVEYEWGTVQVWEPPYRLAFSWHLGSSRELPTTVEVKFISLAENKTRLELEHRGPDLIGELWWQRKDIFNLAWEKILARFGGLLSNPSGKSSEPTTK